MASETISERLTVI